MLENIFSYKSWIPLDGHMASPDCSSQRGHWELPQDCLVVNHSIVISCKCFIHDPSAVVSRQDCSKTIIG